MTSDWDEIKRLAADFQKIQLSSTLQKLSETNCIEVVNLLVEQGLINVIYTVDGKEYITPQHLRREVDDELFVRGGRVSLVELAKTLNVDLNRINDIVEEMAKADANIHFTLGQLMTEAYVQSIAAEINDSLAQRGEISVFELASSHFDLPTEFLLHNVMEKYLGTVIQARQDQEDSSKFFTPKYIGRCKARLRGALEGLTMPTPVSAFFQNIGAQEAMYHHLMTEIAPNGVITSRQKGALYVPALYTKTQVDWVNSFYKQNGYLEYDAVTRLGVSSATNFIKRQLANEKCTYLGKCCVDQRIIGQVESALEECINTGSYLDASSILPSVMSEEDVSEILAVILNPNKLKITQLFGTTILTSQFLEDLVKPCEIIALANAKHSVDVGEYQQHLIESQIGSGRIQELDDAKSDRKDDRRRKATGGKVGGGTQGRETKTKSTKKHYRGGGGDKGRHSDSEEEVEVVTKRKGNNKLQLITVKEIEKAIGQKLESEGLDYLSDTLALHLYPQISHMALTTAQTIFDALQQNTSQDRRQTHAALQEKLNNVLVDIRLYEKGLKLLPAAQHPQLVKYLLKSLGTDICNDLCLYAAAESNIHLADSALTPEQRIKITQDCATEYRSPLAALNKSLTGSSIEDFLNVAETALQACSMILKKVDKKKDRTLVLCHKHGLLEKLNNCSDAALVLHLAVLVIFTISTQNILHASGKHVSSILSFLQPVLSNEQSSTLMQFHDLVLKMLSSTADSEEAKETLASVEQMVVHVKEIASTYKKVGVTATE